MRPLMFSSLVYCAQFEQTISRVHFISPITRFEHSASVWTSYFVLGLYAAR